MEGNWKADKVIYKGILFRSKLEAKVAILLDSMRVNWQYEPDAFELPGGIRYAPDFKINCFGFCTLSRESSHDLYIEVKGIMNKRDALKIELLTSETSDDEYVRKYPVLVIDNIPDIKDQYELCDPESFRCFQRCGESTIAPYNFETIDGDNYGAFPATDGKGHFFLLGVDYYPGGADTTLTYNAYRKAATAMFEPSGKLDGEGRSIYQYTRSGSEITTVRKLENGSYSRECSVDSPKLDLSWLHRKPEAKQPKKDGWCEEIPF